MQPSCTKNTGTSARLTTKELRKKDNTNPEGALSVRPTRFLGLLPKFMPTHSFIVPCRI